MARDHEKRAARMLLEGATLLAEPCPYCSGVRVIKNGDTLCVGCGAEPARARTEDSASEPDKTTMEPVDIIQKKIHELTEELAAEDDHSKQHEILSLIRSLIDTAARLQDTKRGAPHQNHKTV